VSLLFSLPPTGTEPLLETPAYLTDVQTSDNGTEQRRQLRALPSWTVEFPCAASTPGLPWDASRAQRLAALFEAGGAGDYVGPLWQFPRRLTAPVDEGGEALASDLAGLPRLPQAGAYRFVLADLSTGRAEALEASAWTDSTVTLDEPTAGAWPAGALLLPALLGHLAGAPTRERRGPHRLRGGVTFELDLLTSDYAPGAHAAEIYAAAGYAGLDVLTEPLMGPAPPGEGYNRRAATVGGQPGVRVLRAQDDAAGWTRTLAFQLSGQARIEAMRAFLDARKGRAVPFWLPTWDEDLTLAGTCSAGSGFVYVCCPVDVGYDTLVYPLGPHRRHVQLWTHGAAPAYHKLTALGDWADDVREIDLTPNLTATATIATRVSYLRYVRLDTDAPVIARRGPGYASCELPVREIPLECPA